jgi:amino acid adenylation domain-containing protein
MDVEEITDNKKNIFRFDQLITQRVKEYPFKPAIQYGARIITYKDLNDSASRLSFFLRDQGVCYGDVVALAVDRSPEMIIMLLAIVKAGATYLPIDNKLPHKRISYMLSDADAKFLILSDELELEEKTAAKRIFIKDAWEKQLEYKVEQLEFDNDADNLVYILYTSGSTGYPKGVQVKHSGLLNLLLSIRQNPGISSEDIMLATTTISFDIAALELFLPLISGAKLVLADAGASRDGRLLLDIAKKENVTIMQGTPIMWLNMLESGWNDPLPIKVFCGGETLIKELAIKLLPKCLGLWNMYGPTETTIYSLIKQISADDKVITIGKPILNTQVYILDEHQHHVNDGETGEICIGGTGVAKGYINLPELTEEKFINDVFNGNGEKIYRTGDLGRLLSNGEVECFGRIDHQIKIRGHRIETEEIEFQLRKLADIKDALVVSFTDSKNLTHLVAYIIPEQAVVNESAARSKCKNHLESILPSYMIPDTFVSIAEFPRLNNGKLDRKSLPAPILNPEISGRFELPGTETENILSKICLKHIALDKLGINDNFFELGIDSLVAVQIMVQVEELFNKRLPLSTLIQYPTIKALAGFLDNNTHSSPYKTLVPIKPGGDKLPLYIVHGIGLNLLNLYGMISNLDLEQPVYGIQPLGLDGTSEALSNMEEIACTYVKEIIEHNPNGPYIITGYSFGGYIAFEMARQLKAMGKEISMLGMFDTNVQNVNVIDPILKKIMTKLFRQFGKTIFRAHTLLTEPKLTTDYLKLYYKRKIGLIKEKTGITKAYNPDKLPAFMLIIIAKLEKAFQKYKLKPLDVKLDLFKAQSRFYYVDDGQFLGWKKYALKGVKTYNVPGDHESMFQSPNDKVLADILQTRLNKITN